MMRKIFIAALAVLMPAFGAAQTAPAKTVLYAAVGPELTQYNLNPDNATLTRRAAVTLPANIQEAWPDSTHKYLYVAWSNGGASNATPTDPAPKGDHHGISAFQIDPVSGALFLHGKPAPLPSRPIFITTDLDDTHIIAAYNDPSRLTVHQILPDGTIGAEVPQLASLHFGIYGHQVRADPSGKTVILVTRGNGPTPTRPEDPGALKIFSYRHGILSNLLSIAPGEGFGYQVRHLDFHPSGKWAFVTLERQNQIHVYRRMPDGTLNTQPLFVRSTLAETTKAGPGQTAASIHFHPNGKFVYVANRADSKEGENSIAVFTINQETGEPTRIQGIDTRGLQPRTFALDSAGKFLAAANQAPAGLSLFRIGDDGKLEFARKYDFQTGPSTSLFWIGMVSLP
jgi:6-phosphogluconolactonase